jgi:hypothetical protein
MFYRLLHEWAPLSGVEVGTVIDLNDYLWGQRADLIQALVDNGILEKVGE